jgi:hypothetical protein
VVKITEARTGEAKTSVFISYSRKDMAFADRLDVALKERGFDVLIDRQEIYPFEDWWKRIENLIVKADTVIFVLRPDAVASDICTKEVDFAASLNKRFAPIVCRRVEDNATPEPLRNLNFVFFDDPAQFDASVGRLAEALQTDIAWIRKHTDYGEAARRWQAGGPTGGLLLRSPVLEDAERWLASQPWNAPEPTESIRSYVIESRKRARASQWFRRGALTLVGTVVLVGLAAFWEQDWSKERKYALANATPLTAAQEKALTPKAV